MSCLFRPRCPIALLVALVLGSARGERLYAQEAWDAIYAGGSKVGHMHLWIKPVKDGAGRELINVRLEFSLEMRRGRNTTAMEQLYGTIETPEGEILRLETRTKSGGDLIISKGDVTDGEMDLSLTVGSQQTRQRIPWGKDVRGPYGAEMTLTRTPMKPGETREVKTYIPDLNKICVTKLVAKQIEPVALSRQGAASKLLRVEQSVLDLAGKPTALPNSTLWVDDGGQILKSHTPLLGGMYTYRTTRAGALAPNTGPFDLLSESIVRPNARITNSEATRSLTYQITIPDAKVAEILPSDRRQTVTKGATDDTARVRVSTAGIAAGAAATEPPGDEHLRPNPLVNSEDAQVIAHMQKAVGKLTDPWAKAVAIEDWVAKNLRNKNFSTAFAPASEVARTLQGDCSEHSVLVAAMCRAAGVPARCVIGLVYAENIGGDATKYGFGPHMWNEVFVNGRWVALDAAYHQSDVDATHIKVSESSLNGVSPLEAFLPLMLLLHSAEGGGRGIQIDPVPAR